MNLAVFIWAKDKWIFALKTLDAQVAWNYMEWLENKGDSSYLQIGFAGWNHLSEAMI